MPSTAIRFIHYASDTRELQVTFVSGRRYLYFDVPPQLAAAFKDSRSKGTFFNSHIRDGYAYREIRRSA